MELTESIESINKQLVDLFGKDTITGASIWRIVWSEDQLEKRLTAYTDSGLALLQPEVRLLPKYRQWIKQKYVLERLTLVPEINADELPTERLSYEPCFVFENSQGQYLPPQLRVAKFVIDGLYAALGKTNMAKYVDAEAENPIEERRKRLDELQAEMFGNETLVGDALAYKEAIVVPRSYESTNKESK